MTGRHGFSDTGDREHVDAFTQALDGTAAGLLDDTEMLMVIVDRLHGLPGTAALADAGPRPEFRTLLRERLLDEAHGLGEDDDRRVVPITSRWTQSWGRRNRTRLVSGVAAGIVGLTAVSVAAANSLPGSPFYNLKRDSESLRYSLAGSDEARGKLELGFARTRLHEIDRLTEHDAAWGVAPVTTPQAAGVTDTTILATSLNTRVVRLFADMDSEAAKGSALLARSFKNHPRPGPIIAVQQFAKFQEKALASLAPRLSGPALSSATHSLVWAKAAVSTATAVLKHCGTTSCSDASLAHLTGPLAPTPGSPVLPAAVTPSTSPSPGAVPSQTPSQAGQPPVVVPSDGAPTSRQPTQGQPTAAPTDNNAPPAPTGTAGPPTGAPTTPAPPTTPPTTAPPTSPTDGPTTAPPTTPTEGPTTPEPSSTPSTTPTTVPPPPSVPVVTTPPPPSSVAPPPTTAPPTTTPPPPSSTPAPPSAPATGTTAPPTTEPAHPSGRPPVICLPPLKLVGGICIKPGRGPIHT